MRVVGRKGGEKKFALEAFVAPAKTPLSAEGKVRCLCQNLARVNQTKVPLSITRISVRRSRYGGKVDAKARRVATCKPRVIHVVYAGGGVR